MRGVDTCVVLEYAVDVAVAGRPAPHAHGHVHVNSPARNSTASELELGASKYAYNWPCPDPAAAGARNLNGTESTQRRAHACVVLKQAGVRAQMVAAGSGGDGQRLGRGESP